MYTSFSKSNYVIVVRI